MLTSYTPITEPFAVSVARHSSGGPSEKTGRITARRKPMIATLIPRVG